MTERTERLSLGEVEAIVRDALMRAGCDAQAASECAKVIRRAERNNARDHGLGRVPRLLEGLHMSAIDGAAQPVLSRALPTSLHVDAAGGFSDFAISIGFETLTEVSRSYGAALMTVSQTGDLPIAGPWLDRLAERHSIAMSVASAGANEIVFPASGGRVTVPADGLPHELSLRFLLALTGSRPSAGITSELPFTKASNATVCFIAIQPAADAAAGVPTMEDFELRDEAVERARRQHEADTEGVRVSSDLLVRILTS
ncbi:MAG: Ldh family oxidoreductase [Pseudomonadota bacterium]